MLEDYKFGYEGKLALEVLNKYSDSGLQPLPYRHDKFEESFIKAEMPKFDLFLACAKCDHCIEILAAPPWSR